MPFVTSHMSISLDGFVAGPDQSEDNPLGVDGITSDYPDRVFAALGR